jgi:hypothetical protein
MTTEQQRDRAEADRAEAARLLARSYLGFAACFLETFSPRIREEETGQSTRKDTLCDLALGLEGNFREAFAGLVRDAINKANRDPERN